jgi:hypothetical protein
MAKGDVNRLIAGSIRDPQNRDVSMSWPWDRGLMPGTAA